MSGDSREWQGLHPLSNKNVQVLNFNPLENGRDRFGNRLITSPTIGFFNRKDEESKAALLISTEGEIFIKNHKGILKEIEEAINQFKQNLQLKNLKLSQGEIEFVLEHNSDIYKITLQDGEYILKVPTDRSGIRPGYENYFEDVSQPYINEMLQLQEFDEEFGPELDKLGIEINAILFASNSVSLSRFIPGKHPERKNLLPILNSLTPEIEKFIHEREKKNIPLWENIHQDLDRKKPKEAESYPARDNFIERPDESLVIIDAFAYKKNPIPSK